MKLPITGSVFFVANTKDLTASLFAGGSTAAGTYKIRKRGVLFLNLQGEPFAYLCANEEYTPFFVTCSKQEDGRIRYMLGGLCTPDETYLGLAGKGFRECREIALAAWQAAKQILAARKAERSAPAPPVRSLLRRRSSEARLSFPLPSFLQ